LPRAPNWPRHGADSGLCWWTDVPDPGAAHRPRWHSRPSAGLL